MRPDCKYLMLFFALSISVINTVPLYGAPQIKLTTTTAPLVAYQISEKLKKQSFTPALEAEANGIIARLERDGFKKLANKVRNVLTQKKPVVPKIVPVTTGQSSQQFSQTESYLKMLGKTRDEAYAKIQEVLAAPLPSLFKKTSREQAQMRQDKANYERINPQEYNTVINEVIKSEKQHPDYYVLYNGSDKAIMFLHLFSTYLTQLEYSWTRNDFFILRSPEEFYTKNAETAADYIRQNTKPNAQQLAVGFNKFADITKQFVRSEGKKCQFDMIVPIRSQLVSCSPAFIAGVDDTPMEIRNMLDGDFPAWESSFYYFSTNLSWVDFDRAEQLLLDKIRSYCPQIFQDGPINNLTKEYITLRFNLLSKRLLPKAKKLPADEERRELMLGLLKEEDQQMKAGIMYQIFIPKDIIDKVAYLAWQNGTVWQRKINNITDGWDEQLGMYTRISPILDILQKEPQRLGRSINLLQVRLIYKDKKYLFDPSSPIKMNIITTLPESLLRSIQDSLKALANVVYGFKKALKEGNLSQWAETINLENEISTLKRLQSNDEKQQSQMTSAN